MSSSFRLTVILMVLSSCKCVNKTSWPVEVGLLDRALISLGLAVSPRSTSVSSDLMVLCKCYFVKIILTSLYLVGLALYLVDWPTIVLQCFVTVGWVIWPVKIVPSMTYNVFGGTSNPTYYYPQCPSETGEAMASKEEECIPSYTIDCISSFTNFYKYIT